MNKGEEYPGYRTDESVGSSSTEDENLDAGNFGTEDLVAEDFGTENDGSEKDTQKQSASLGTDSGLNVSTLSFLKKMHGVQENFARQLKTLSKKCDKWERRALNAEREVLAAEAVIERMVGLADSEMNTHTFQIAVHVRLFISR